MPLDQNQRGSILDNGSSLQKQGRQGLADCEPLPRSEVGEDAGKTPRVRFEPNAATGQRVRTLPETLQFIATLQLSRASSYHPASSNVNWSGQWLSQANLSRTENSA